MAVILAADPGARSTGLVVRDGEALLAHTTVSRPDAVSVHDYLRAVLDVCDGLVGALEGRRPAVLVDAVAVEEVVAPGVYVEGRKRVLHPQYAIDTATVAGGVAGWGRCRPVVWVPVGGNGQGALDAYPAELRPARGRGAGRDNLRHERSAWDCATTAAMLLSPEGATSGGGSSGGRLAPVGPGVQAGGQSRMSAVAKTSDSPLSESLANEALLASLGVLARLDTSASERYMAQALSERAGTAPPEAPAPGGSGGDGVEDPPEQHLG